MSSNIRVQRICQYCGKEFTAKTTVTQYCGDDCAKRAYKAKQKGEKIELSNRVMQQFRNKAVEDLKDKEFLTVRQVSKILGCSRQNVYKLINNSKLRATNILIKKTIVRRLDLDNLFEIPQQEPHIQPTLNPAKFEIADYYNLTEVQNKYGISETALQQLVKRHSIPKIKKGSLAYVSKIEIDALLS